MLLLVPLFFLTTLGSFIIFLTPEGSITYILAEIIYLKWFPTLLLGQEYFLQCESLFSLHVTHLLPLTYNFKHIKVLKSYYLSIESRIESNQMFLKLNLKLWLFRRPFCLWFRLFTMNWASPSPQNIEDWKILRFNAQKQHIIFGKP